MGLVPAAAGPWRKGVFDLLRTVDAPRMQQVIKGIL